MAVYYKIMGDPRASIVNPIFSMFLLADLLFYALAWEIQGRPMGWLAGKHGAHGRSMGQ